MRRFKKQNGKPSEENKTYVIPILNIAIAMDYRAKK